MVLTKEQFNEYKANPIEKDSMVRGLLNLREDRYYTVSIWPIEGVVRYNNLSRVTKANKISKSNQ